MASHEQPAPGTILAGKYRVDRVLGQGGMGVVVAAWHLQLHQPVALKFLLPEASAAPEVVERFFREARAAVRLQSEHAAKVIDVGTLDSGAPYLVMELLDGSDLSAVLEKHGPLTPQATADFILQAIDAIAEAHANHIVHRDLKPANLFLARRTDGSSIIKVLDFGISKSVDPGQIATSKAALTSTSAVMGSPLYMSPEQMRSAKKVDARTDVWALGAIMYELLSGRPPFFGETMGEVFAAVLQDEPPALRSLRPDVPPGLEQIIVRCLRKMPEQRFASVAELATAIAPFGSGISLRSVDRAQRLLASSAGRTSDPSLRATPPPSSPHAIATTGSPPSSQLPAVAGTINSFGRTSGTSGGSGAKIPLIVGGAALVIGTVVVAAVVAVKQIPAPVTASSGTASTVSAVATALPPAASVTVATDTTNPTVAASATASAAAIQTPPPASATPPAASVTKRTSASGGSTKPPKTNTPPAAQPPKSSILDSR